MGKKCCQKKSSYNCCDNSSSSSYGFCCTKYPKCKCTINKCAPIYYPNNCVGKYPCPPPCPPLCPPPYCPTQCGTKYTSNNSIITSSTTLNSSSQNVYICNSSANITITLPAISSLSACGFTKMFVISNISSFNVEIITTGDSLTNSSASTLTTGNTITLYAVNVLGGAYWVVA